MPNCKGLASSWLVVMARDVWPADRLFCAWFIFGLSGRRPFLRRLTDINIVTSSKAANKRLVMFCQPAKRLPFTGALRGFLLFVRWQAKNSDVSCGLQRSDTFVQTMSKFMDRALPSLYPTAGVGDPRYDLLRARPKAERVHRQLAEIFNIERPGPTRPDPARP